MRLIRFGNDRGQALLETAISLPLFILAMYGLFWSIRQSTLAERLQLGTRYGGIVSSLSNPYLSYSLYSMYAAMDSAQPDTAAACGVPAETNALGGRKSFFTAVAPVPDPTCTPGFIQFFGPEAYHAPILLQSEWVSLTAAAPINGLAFMTSGAPPATVASQNFFRAPDVGQVTACSAIGAPFKKSLEPGTDTAFATSPATAFPQVIKTDAPTMQSCQSLGTAAPAPSGPIPTPPPSPSPQPTATPKPTSSPTPTPIPTPTPVPTPTHTPKPTATPTAIPTATPKPTATPTPTAPPTASPIPTPTHTPTPKPTASPVPTSTPVPTATPTKTPTPTPSPTPTPKPTASPTPVPTPTPSPTPNINGTPPGGSNS